MKKTKKQILDEYIDRKVKEILRESTYSLNEQLKYLKTLREKLLKILPKKYNIDKVHEMKMNWAMFQIFGKSQDEDIQIKMKFSDYDDKSNKIEVYFRGYDSEDDEIRDFDINDVEKISKFIQKYLKI